MNIYELEKKATPGPFNLVLQASGEDICIIQDRKPMGHTIANVWFALCPDGEANAKMLVHCRNNFMRALQELKWCADRMAEYKILEGRTIKLIEELEEVKV